MAKAGIELEQEYDEIYKVLPGKWEDAARDLRAMNLLRKHKPAPRNLLDIGCGNGHTLHFFSRYWDRQIAYSGMDISRVALNLAQRKLPGAAFYHGQAGEMKLQERYDVITLLGVAEHLPEPVKTMRKLAKYLDKDGIMLVEVPRNLKEGEEEGRRASSLQMEWHFNKEHWERILTSAGYRIVDKEEAPGAYLWVVQHGNANQ